MRTGSKSLHNDSRQRVLLVVNSAIGPRMSGPGIRYWEFARSLGRVSNLDVTLATVPGIAAQCPDQEMSCQLRASRDEADLRALARQADVVIAPGAVVSLYPSLLEVGKPLVLDLYIPLLLEELQRTRPESLSEQALFFDRLRRSTMTQLLSADLILCASEKQRDYWLGALSAVGRVNPYAHSQDPTFRHLVAVVPFGLPSQPPRHTRRVLKGVFPGIGPDDKVLLWGGGLYDWLDPLTLIRAMDSLATRRLDVKLFFMGVDHPNLQEVQRRGTRETLDLTDDLGLSGRNVIFNDWVPYDERENFLLEADIGVSLHRDHLETRFSFRTRFLDYVWAGLPIIATRGDVLGGVVEREGLGRVVDPGDVDGLVKAILDLIETPNLRQTYKSRFEQVAAAYRWEVVTRPLIAFCSAPRLAPDKGHLKPSSALRRGPTPWWQLPRKALRALRAGGIDGLTRQMRGYWRWMIHRRGRR